MANYDDALIQEMRSLAAELTKVANSDVDLEKMASVHTESASSGRSDYLLGVIEGLGIRC